jgi:hypothetical protein
MTPTKLPNSRPRASARITCYGTAFLSDAPLDAKLLMQGIAPAVPQFSSPRLDASFLINCGRFLSGKVATREGAPITYFKRIAGTDFRLPKATHCCQFSAELCDLLAALTDERAAEIALRWHDMILPTKAKPAEPNGRTKRRLAILKNLVALAKQAKGSNKTLILRVEYRKQR